MSRDLVDFCKESPQPKNESEVQTSFLHYFKECLKMTIYNYINLCFMCYLFKHIFLYYYHITLH
jgi:hypothetical protein